MLSFTKSISSALVFEPKNEKTLSEVFIEKKVS
jgi:hypothetical protein